MSLTISQEIAGIQTAVNTLIAEQTNPTKSVLTPADQASLDALASSVGAPTSTSTPVVPPPIPATSAPAA